MLRTFLFVLPMMVVLSYISAAHANDPILGAPPFFGFDATEEEIEKIRTEYLKKRGGEDPRHYLQFYNGLFVLEKEAYDPSNDRFNISYLLDRHSYMPYLGHMVLMEKRDEDSYALEEFQKKMIYTWPDRAAPRAAVAAFHLEHDELAECEEVIERAFKKHKGDAQLHFVLGQCLGRQENWNGVLENFSHVKGIDRLSDNFAKYYAMALYRTNKFKEFQEYADEYAKANPGRFPAEFLSSFNYLVNDDIGKFCQGIDNAYGKLLVGTDWMARGFLNRETGSCVAYKTCSKFKTKGTYFPCADQYARAWAIKSAKELQEKLGVPCTVTADGYGYECFGLATPPWRR